MTDAARRPNLFLVGSMKCGTTSLHNMLATHPSIFMCQNPKEPAWFSGGNSGKDLDWYLERFADAADQSFVGESSTDYTKAPRLGCAAAKIKAFAKDARILYIMRDPVARAVSHYWWEVEYSAEGRSFPEAMKSAREIADVGHYAMQIAPYIEAFGRERVHALTMEELTADPERAMGAIYDFLRLEHVAREAAPLPRDNAGKSTVPRVTGSAALSRLKGTPVWLAAKALIPSSLRKQAMAALARPVERAIPGDDLAAAVESIRPRMIAETQRLSQLLGREFPEWRWLHDAVPPASIE
ncbi:MAG: sulfotransferase [Parvularculaceae bacterium]